MIIKDLLNSYYKLRQHGVALYGAGVRGVRAVEVLERCGIDILCIADQVEGKSIGKHITISLKELVAREDVFFCIITPKVPLPEIEQMAKRLKIIDYSFINWLIYFFPNEVGVEKIESCKPFGHYESPYPNEEEIERVPAKEVLDIDFNEKKQISFFNEANSMLNEYFSIKESGNKMRYKENSMFSDLDAIVLYLMIRKHSPKKIIEIGSGFSTSIMLDINEYFFNNAIEITCIEPNTERLRSILKADDNIVIHENLVQNVPLAEFEKLEENDFLFIDSSHVARRGGDVPYEFFQILPRLNKGVFIHIHDIHYPFEYCKDWIMQMRAYNEIYILRALLMNNNVYEIELFNSYMEMKHRNLLEEMISNWNNYYGSVGAPNGSIWLRKVR